MSTRILERHTRGSLARCAIQRWIAAAGWPEAIEPSADWDPSLTKRELEVLGFMAQGAHNDEVARSLWLSPDTVKTHASRLFRKLGARDRAHAVAIGIRSGLIG